MKSGLVNFGNYSPNLFVRFFFNVFWENSPLEKGLFVEEVDNFQPIKGGQLHYDVYQVTHTHRDHMFAVSFSFGIFERRFSCVSLRHIVHVVHVPVCLFFFYTKSTRWAHIFINNNCASSFSSGIFFKEVRNPGNFCTRVRGFKDLLLPSLDLKSDGQRERW